MFRVVSNISIQQRPSTAWPNRKTLIGMNFCSSYEASDNWRDLTNNGKLVIPKNLYFRDQYGKLRPLAGTNVNVGGFDSNAPLAMRGDAVKIVVGYKYFNAPNAQRETTSTAQVFSGYISKVDAKQPIEITLEDNMWLAKQTPVDTMTFTISQGLNTILAYLVGKINALYGTSLTYNALTNTTFATFPIGNETVCQVLQRLQKIFGFESYFRGNELRSGLLIYIPGEAITRTFTFQKDILPDDNLEYVRKDDIVLSAVARNTVQESVPGKLTKDGFQATKKVRLEVLVTLRNGKTSIYPILKGKPVPENTEGERRTLFFPGAQNITDLANLAIAELTKYYYDGLKGDFSTFGLPFVRQGDNVKIVNNILPEIAGTYKVKEVKYKGGATIGIRQQIYLDFKIPT